MTLPDPLALGVGPEATIAVPVPAGGLRLYRRVEGAQARARDFEVRRTRPQARERGIPELLRLSVSHWTTPEAVAANSRDRRPWVAEVVLAAGGLVRVALTDKPGHVDVWADPDDLLAGVARVARFPHTA